MQPYSGLLIVKYEVHDDYKNSVSYTLRISGCDCDVLELFEELKVNPCRFLRHQMELSNVSFIFKSGILQMCDERLNIKTLYV